MKLIREFWIDGLRFMKEEALSFETNVDVGKDLFAGGVEEAAFDRILLACEPANPVIFRCFLPGRDSKHSCICGGFLYLDQEPFGF